MYLYYRLGHDLENQLNGRPPIGEVLQNGKWIDVYNISDNQRALVFLYQEQFYLMPYRIGRHFDGIFIITMFASSRFKKRYGHLYS